jgi:hypothetical protein
MFASVTDYGNFSFAWRHYTDNDDEIPSIDVFKNFILNMGVDYFATKMMNGMSYVVSNKKVDSAIDKYANKILPAFQKVLREEKETR